MPASTPVRHSMFWAMILWVLAANAFGQTPAEDEAVVEGEIGQRIVEFVQAAVAEGFSGAVLAARDGKVIAAIGAGSADLEGQHRNTPATLFEIASATKQFTAAALMRLVMDGRLNLDDAIAKHLPDVPENCRAITVEHLLRHTSGIPGSNSQGGGDDIAQVLPSFLRGGPQHEPGAHWEYWNQGYAILTEIIARAAGKDYVTYCKEALFTPAGMKTSCFTGDAAPEDARVAVGQSARGPARSALDHPYGSYGFQYRGMGGAVCSAWDLWRWDRALRGDTILDSRTKSKLFEPGLGDYALGWFVKKNPRGRLVQSHGGGVRGFICEMRRYPNDDAFLVVLCNRDDAPLRRIAQSVEEILFGDPPSAPKPLRALVPDLIASLQGNYRDERGTSLVIESDGAAKLITKARIHWSPPSGPITHAIVGLDEQGKLMMNDGSPSLIALEISRDADGLAESVSILKRSFTRIKPGQAGDGPKKNQPKEAKDAKDSALPIDPGMNMMITTTRYRLNEHGVAHLPPTARWLVQPQYVGAGADGQRHVDDRITLVLQDTENSFWPVIARMDVEVAEKLVKDLQAMIESRKAGVE